MQTGQPRAAQEWKRHWTLVLAAMVGMSFYAVITYSLGTFIEPLENEFGWSRARISMGLMVFTVVATLGGPFIGMLIDRFGTRRVAIPGLALHAVAFAALGLANGSFGQWLVIWAFLAVVALSTKALVWSAAVSSVFVAGRSMALAVMLSGTAVGQSLAPLLANRLIADHGWREAYFGIGLGWGGLALALCVLFFFDARAGQKRAGGPQVAAPVLGGLTIRQAARDSRVIRIALANVVFSTMGSAVAIHLVPILSATGLDRSGAVEVAAVAGVAGIVGKLLVGWLLDRVPGSLVPVICFLLPGCGYFLLLDTFGSVAALTVGVAILGFASGAGLQISTYLISRYAGLRNFGAIFGAISSAMMLGMSFGPLLAGLIYDATGSYALLLTGAIPIAITCSLLFLRLGPYPDFRAQPSLSDTATG